jgi:NTP pyrophosphatase (non-canonical NTP hydrolase)
MFKEIGKLKGLLNYPQQLILGLDNIAHVNGEGLTLTVATEECAELIQAITKLKRYGFYERYKNDLHEEVADVLICITELVALGYLDIDKVVSWQKIKVNREVERAIQKEEIRKDIEKYGVSESQ